MSAAPAAAATTAATKAAVKVSYVDRFLVQPVCRTLSKVEARSQAKLNSAQKATTSWIAQHDAAGTDAAATSTKHFMKQQGSLINYRVVRCFHEGRYVVSGEYFKNYGVAKALHDARWATQALLFFIIAVMVGRRSVFPPIHPDSPLAIALEHKSNPNY